MAVVIGILLIYWFSLSALAHTWFLYGLILYVLVRLRPDAEPHKPSMEQPTVSVIIAAHNEEAAIRGRIENLRAMRHDPSKLEIIVASDGSTDATPRIVREIQATCGGIRLLAFPRQRGRAVVHNEAAAEACGDLLLFTDAETRFREDFLQRLLPHFQDPSVGAASGRIQYVNEQDTSITVSAGQYWKLEERLRSWESRLGILAFGTGAAFCIRRNLYAPLSPNEDIDYALSIKTAARGHRVVYEPEAVAYDILSPSALRAHKARIRQTSRASMSILGHLMRTRSLWRRPALLWSVVSHKTLRHLTPFLIVALGLSNLLLWPHGAWYRATLTMQAALYMLAVLGGLGYLLGWRIRPLALPFTFALLNFSRMWGVLRGIFRRPPSAY